MSAIVFDINNEYRGLPDSYAFVPGQNLRFRLDRIQPRTFIDLIDRIAPFAERTAYVARAELPRVIKARAEEAGHVPDLAWLRSQAGNIIKGGGDGWVENMRASFRSSIEAVERCGLIMTEAEALAENESMKHHQAGKGAEPPAVVSLSSVLSNIEHGQKAGVIIFDIGGLLPFIQYAVVDLIVDTLKEICRRQTENYRKGNILVPNYPTIYFEEAHMYMEPRVIDELLLRAKLIAA